MPVFHHHLADDDVFVLICDDAFFVFCFLASPTIAYFLDGSERTSAPRSSPSEFAYFSGEPLTANINNDVEIGMMDGRFPRTFDEDSSSFFFFCSFLIFEVWCLLCAL